MDQFKVVFKKMKWLKILTGASGGADDVTGSAVSAIASGNTRLAVAVASQLVAFVADTAVDVAEARLTGHALTGIPVISVVAFLAAVAAESPGALATLRAVTQQLARVGEISVRRRAGARPASARLVGFAVKALGALLAMISRGTFPAVGAPPSFPVASFTPAVAVARLGVAHQVDQHRAGHVVVLESAIVAPMGILTGASGVF